MLCGLWVSVASFFVLFDVFVIFVVVVDQIALRKTTRS